MKMHALTIDDTSLMALEVAGGMLRHGIPQFHLPRGKIAGLTMEEVNRAESCVPETTATFDTIGIDPAYKEACVGATLFEESASHLRKIGVHSISPHVIWNPGGLPRFFEKWGLAPSRVVHLELVVG